MNGQLNTHPLIELIHEISDARLSGVLRLARGQVRAAVYFEGGQAVSALTNIRAFRLVEMFRRGGSVDASRLGHAAREGLSDEQAGLILIRSGLITPADLKRLQERQSSEVLRELLRWDEGEWNFDPRVRLAGNYRVHTDATRLLVEAARELTPEVVSQRVSDAEEEFAPAPGAHELTGGVQLLPSEAYVLSRVEGRMRLSEVFITSGLPEDETRRAVYVLALGRLLERERWPRALPTAALRQTTTPAATAGASAEADVQRPAEAPEAQIVAAQTERDAREDIEELFARASGATHYEVLGVTRSSPPDELKRAYYSLARRFHPDRFRRDADDDMQQRIDAAFAKIAQAYEALKDSKLRATYDLKISRQVGAAPSQDSQRADSQGGTQSADARAGQGADARVAGQGSPRGANASDAAQDSSVLLDAERKFQQGLAALERNDVARARNLLGEAARLAPAQARYRAHFGRALSRDKTTRRQAEAEYQAAVTLDGANASYHVMLAELYVDVGLRRKAEAELSRALSLEPGDTRASRLLEELRRAS